MSTLTADRESIIRVAKAALAQDDTTPENERMSCRRLLELAIPLLENADIQWGDHDWRECSVGIVRDTLHRAGVPHEVAWALMCRLQDGARAAWDLRLARERVAWLTSCLPETKHWPPSTRDPYARAPSESDG